MSDRRIQRLGLMRHAQANRPSLEPEERFPHRVGLSRTGVREACAVADRLAETVLADGTNRTVGNILILYAPTEPARETAEVIAEAINMRWAESSNQLEQAARLAEPTGNITPATVGTKVVKELAPAGPGLSSREAFEKWGEIVGETMPDKLIVIAVGHDP